MGKCKPSPRFQIGILQFQSFTRHILRGELELDVGSADLLKAFAHDAVCKGGFVALAAQMGEVKVF